MIKYQNISWFHYASLFTFFAVTICECPFLKVTTFFESKTISFCLHLHIKTCDFDSWIYFTYLILVCNVVIGIQPGTFMTVMIWSTYVFVSNQNSFFIKIYITLQKYKYLKFPASLKWLNTEKHWLSALTIWNLHF